MAIPVVFAPVKPQDFTLKPYMVHKRFKLSSDNLISTSSGYNLIDGVHTTLKTPIGSPRASNDPTNSFDGSYQHIIWQSYNHMYYKNGYNKHSTFEHSNRRYTYKFLNYSASILSMPYMDYGESIKPNSINIVNNTHGFSLTDDGNGNIYDSSIDSGSFTNNYNIIGYWGFNKEFNRFKYRSGVIEKSEIGYTSYVFEPDEYSIMRNIEFDVGVENTGMCAKFDGTSYIMTHDRVEFTPSADESFTIGFWINAPASQSNNTTSYNSIISKRGVIRKQVFGLTRKVNKNDLVVMEKHVSSSIVDLDTDVYPYDIELINSTGGADSGKIRVRRSDGVTISSIISNDIVTDSGYHYVTLTMNTGSMKLYIDGIVQGSSNSLVDIDIYNNHSIMFGVKNRASDGGFSGSLDEIRIYDTEITSTQMSSLLDSSSMAMYQTAVVGNAFYRQGNIIISPLQPKYLNTFKGSWNMDYRGSHTIYQYEVLCRVKKGSFNMTYNPTARKSFKSDLLTDEMTGSLLLPYITTIGLYNSDGECVIVGKMATPVQCRDDVDLNFLIRIDS